MLDPTRAIDLPGVEIVGVGGARLGGSGRTPLAIAMARALGGAYVGHAYGARPERARVVRRDDDVRVVGDEALIAARALETEVIVAPSRAEALRFAATRAPLLVVDRLLQTRPRRLACSLLAHDRAAKHAQLWPFGDMVTSFRQLADAADEQVEIGGLDAREQVSVDARVRGARVGLVTSMARAHRVVDALAAMGIAPSIHVKRRDHQPMTAAEARGFARRSRSAPVDVWLLDAKTATLAPDLGVEIGHAILPSAALLERVRDRLARR